MVLIALGIEWFNLPVIDVIRVPGLLLSVLLFLLWLGVFGCH